MWGGGLRCRRAASALSRRRRHVQGSRGEALYWHGWHRAWWTGWHGAESLSSLFSLARGGVRGESSGRPCQASSAASSASETAPLGTHLASAAVVLAVWLPRVRAPSPSRPIASSLLAAPTRRLSLFRQHPARGQRLARIPAEWRRRRGALGRASAPRRDPIATSHRLVDRSKSTFLGTGLARSLELVRASG